MASVGRVTPPRPAVPSGGSAGQILGRDGTAVTWLPTGGRSYLSLTSGTYLDNRWIQTTYPTSAFSTSTQTNYFSWWSPQSFSISNICLYANQRTANTTMTGSLHTSNPTTGQPASMLASGTVAVTAVGQVTIPCAATVPAGWSYIGINGSGSGLSLTAGNSQFGTFRFPLGSASGPHVGASDFAYWSQSGGGAPVDNPTVAFGTANTLSQLPLIWLQIA